MRDYNDNYFDTIIHTIVGIKVCKDIVTYKIKIKIIITKITGSTTTEILIPKATTIKQKKLKYC